MKKILFIANNRTMLSGMIFLIEQMQEKYGNTVIPILICESCYYETDKYKVINLSEEKQDETLGTLDKPITDFYNQESRKIRKQICRFFYNYRRMVKDDRKSKKILKTISPDALIVADDRMAGILQGFLKNAKSIPRIKVTIAEQTDYRKGFDLRYYNCELILTDKFWDLNRILLFVNKPWVRCINGECRVFYPLGYSLAGWAKGMISMHPWVSGAGKSTHVLAASEDERNMILEEAKKPVIVTGMVEDYYILLKRNEKMKIVNELRTKYHVQHQIVIFSMPQLAEHNMVAWEIHKDNMRILVQILNEIFGTVLVSLHPKSRLDDYSYLLEYGAFFLEERLKDVICGADILVAVSGSSIWHWTKILSIGKVAIDISCLLGRIGDTEEIKEKILKDALTFEEKVKQVNNNIKCVSVEIMSIVNIM